MPKIFVYERGQGTPVVFLHGFPFNHTVWNSFADKLSANFRVVTPDLPGFGKSSLLEGDFSIDDVAQAVILELRAQGIDNCVLIGHSLGGYVTLAMAKQAQRMFSAIALFHSTAYPDSPEKKESRNKVLTFIDNHGVDKFTSNFIAPLFADQGHPAIKQLQTVAMQASESSVKAYTIAMRDRSERTDVIEKFPKPILFIVGEKDAGISVESIEKQSRLNPLSEVHVLTNVAHMGMLESEQQSLDIITRFIQNNQLLHSGS